MTTLTHDYGPLRTYEITWATGHVEYLRAHQITWPYANAHARDERVFVHGELDGHWRLLLAARPEDIHTIRDITDGEWLTRAPEEADPT